MTTWGDWLTEYHDTTVLSLETSYYSPRSYEAESDPSSGCFNCRASVETMFPVWDRDDRLDAKEEVLALTDGDVSKAYPLTTLQELRVVNDRVGDLEVVEPGLREIGLPVYLVDHEGREV